MYSNPCVRQLARLERDQPALRRTAEAVAEEVMAVGMDELEEACDDGDDEACEQFSKEEVTRACACAASLHHMLFAFA